MVNNYEDNNKKKNLIAFIKKIKQPKTFYSELAEMDLLLDYIYEYDANRFNQDEEFQDEVFKVIFENSKRIEPKLEAFLLERLIRSLSYFNEIVSEWADQNQ